MTSSFPRRLYPPSVSTRSPFAATWKESERLTIALRWITNRGLQHRRQALQPLCHFIPVLQSLPKAVGTPMPFKVFRVLSLFCVSNGSASPLPPSYNVASRNPYLCKNASLLLAETFISPFHNIVLQGRRFCSSNIA